MKTISVKAVKREEYGKKAAKAVRREGKTIFVGDLNFDGVKFLTPATTAVCAVRVTRASRGADAAAAK